MKNDKRGVVGKFLIQAIFLVGLLGWAMPATADEISIVADEWAPYNGDPNSATPGYGIEIAKQVFEAAGHTVVYKILPWSRAIESTRKGKYSAIIGAYKEDAPDFIFPQEEFGLSEMALFVKRGGPWESWEYNGLESLKKVKVGAAHGYSYGEVVDKFFEDNPEIVNYAHGDDPLTKNIKMLLAGRFAVLIEDPNVLFAKAKKMGVSDQIIKTRGKQATEGIEVYIAFSPKNSKSKEYAQILDKGINQLKASEQLEAILSKYGLTYWK